MNIQTSQTIMDKLEILGDAAKFDVACTSSGAQSGSYGSAHNIGSKCLGGICHSFSADGRCITLLKVLMTNTCINNCKYCMIRASNNKIKRSIFTPLELADLTIEFYKRNYIEGLFLSSGIIKNADYTSGLILATLKILRNKYNFVGYIHAKAIPGTSADLIKQIGFLADRISINLELPSQKSLTRLAPQKNKDLILKPMGFIANQIIENSHALSPHFNGSFKTIAPIKNTQSKFAPAGQSTQIIIGASPEDDKHILTLVENLYNKYKLKRIFYSAYMPVSDDTALPAPTTPPPLLRQHRLYQADWLMRFYKFKSCEILDDQTPMLSPFIDPKCNWALKHPEFFPIEINAASYDTLLRIPGIGVKSVRNILMARKNQSLDFEDLKKLGVVLKRAKYFILCKGKKFDSLSFHKTDVLQALMSQRELQIYSSFIKPVLPGLFDTTKVLING